MKLDIGTVQIGTIQIFCKAAELGSFTLAAEALGITPAAVSRSVARLEERLHVQLFMRSTRKINLSDDGRLYWNKCRDAIQQIEEVESLLTGRKSTPYGTLRISVPTTYGNMRFMPILAKFRQKYPQLNLDVNVSNRNVDFVDQGCDLTIRLGMPQDSRLVARRLEDAKLGVYTSESYIARRGIPANLTELADHDCIQFIQPSSGRPMSWIFRDGDQDVDFPLENNLRFSGDVLGCVGYAASGGGLFQTYDFIANNPQFAGLVEVLHEFRGRSRPFCILYPYNRHLSAKVRALVDMLVSEVAELSK